MKRILFFGDSLTAGYGLNKPSQQSFPALIQNRINTAGLKYECINAGLSGDTSASGLNRLSYWLGQTIDVFVLALGANDLIRGLAPTNTQSNLQQIFDQVRFKHPDAKFLLLGMQLPLWVPGQRAAEYRQLYQNLAGQNQIPLLPFLLDGVAGIAHLNMHDGLHPLAEGYQIIAAKVWPVLLPLLE
ncbi:arylesterase [Pedobacter sp. GR22-6]|uniref:arylesterase n=1 Tax=Pedobacter sp. GR22-6 TaxID=3127957 RepID=UPI00307E9093